MLKPCPPAPHPRRFSRPRVLIAACSMATILAAPSAAWAQEAVRKLDEPTISPPFGEWTVKWSASAEQAFTFDRTEVNLDLIDAQDEGEYTVGSTLKGSFSRFAEISFSPVVTVNPYLFDDQDETSAWSFRARLQRKIEITDAEVRDQRRADQDNIIPFVSYKIGRSFTQLFGGDATDSREFTIGSSYANILGYLCKPEEAPRTGCTGGAGTQYKVTLSYSTLDSDNDDKDRRGPRLAVEWSRPIMATAALFVDASVDGRSYETLLADNGSETAEATQVALAVGVDVSRWARRQFRLSDNVEVKMAARWIMVEADREDLDRDEFSLVPTVSWVR